MNAKRVVIVQMWFEEGNRKSRSECAQAATNRRSMAINFNLDEFPFDFYAVISVQCL